jgi:hypothetical protein
MSQLSINSFNITINNENEHQLLELVTTINQQF